MTQKLTYIITILLFSLSSCTGKSSSSSNDNTKDDYTYSDGNYNAEIEYYNSKTSRSSTYTLKVEIEDDNLVKIYWSNGGWLDDSHFTPPDISSGVARFISDRGYRYLVTMLDDEISESDINSYSAEDEESDNNECPECGFYKYSYDDYCSDCQEKNEEEYE